ncbi:MAG: hypothetical protein IMW98_04745 [Firmicutes bacterium]|nr:hypothetical protein [Bacillota bacterium]
MITVRNRQRARDDTATRDAIARPAAVRARRRARALLALGALLVALLWAPPADAHITGVFLYFLKDVQGQTGQTSLDILAGQLRETDARIRALEPQVEAARRAYEAQLGPAQKAVRFYSLYAAEGFAGAVFGSGNVVDALANAVMVRDVVQRDLARLQETAAAYRVLKERRAELVAYRDLLEAFTEAEERHRAVLQGKSAQDQELALYTVSENWEEIRSGPLRGYIDWAAARLSGLRAAAAAEAGGWLAVDEAAFNRLAAGRPPVQGVEAVRVLLRADHVYVVGRFRTALGERQVILVGQMARAGAGAVRYQVEYALVDGFLIDPQDPQMRELVADDRFFRITAADLGVPAGTLQFEQESGRLRFRPAAAR